MSQDFKVHKPISQDHEFINEFSPLLAQLLVNRGLGTIDDAQSFLNPSWEDVYDPFLMKNVREGVERLKEALDTGEKITIYADYDADGIPGAVVLSSLLDKLGHSNYDVYLPHRHDEGYGIHIEALEKIKASGSTLIITIDVGITGHEAAQWSNDNDIDMIITDHHEPLLHPNGSQNLPEPFLLINPKQEGCGYPDHMLCGCGVIFKFIQGFLETHKETYQIHDGWEKWLLDMVGLATISDMVPLLNENRIFAHFGMKVIPKTKRLGLKKLIWNAGLDMRYLTEEDLAFSVTPKLNAASRMSHPEDALAALRAASDVEATTSVNHLDQLNKERKKLVANTMKKVHLKLRDRNIGTVIVIGAPDWQAGILGLVASKIVEHYKVPTFVWGEEQGVIKGSCRTYAGVNLVELMSRAERNSFIQFGGHAEAGGFSCEKNEIHFLQERLETAFQKHEENNAHQEFKPIMIDLELSLNEVTRETYQTLRSLAPFGQANTKPLFLFKKVTPEKVEQFGKQQNHLKLWFKNDRGQRISGIKFFADPNTMTEKPEDGKPIDIIAHIDYSVFRGKHELRLGIIDTI